MATTERVAPNQSLYIQNLPEKLQKEDLRRELYMLFSTYGSVLDITAMKTKRMRGQAHILFRDVDTAVQAMRACQGFDFFGRELRINFAKSRSQTLAKMSGTFTPDEPSHAPTDKAPTSTFPPPPSSLPPPPSTLPAPPKGLPVPLSNGTNLTAPSAAAAAVSAPSPQGVKRSREDSDEEAPMDENDDDGEGEMDMSEDDD